MADHGGAVLIAGPGERATELHRLDVVSGRVTPWASLPRTPLPQSYDGGVLIVPGPTGLEGIDTTSDPPRVLWNEVGADGIVLAFTRSATHLAAIVDLPLAGRRRERSVEVWRWELPGRKAFQRDLRTDAWAAEPGRGGHRRRDRGLDRPSTPATGCRSTGPRAPSRSGSARRTSSAAPTRRSRTRTR